MKTRHNQTVTDAQSGSATADRVLELWTDLRKKADGEFKNPEDFLYLPISNYVPHVKAWSGGEHVVLVGIGGSSLGAKAVYNAIFGCLDPVTPTRFPKLHTLENVDSSYASSLVGSLGAEGSPNVTFVIVSKSGKTYETKRTLELLTTEKYIDREELFCLLNTENTFVVSVEESPLWERGKKLGAQLYPMPQVVSGRFQIFGAACLVPLFLAGINTTKFIEGAKLAIDSQEDIQKNAATRFEYYQNGWDSDVYFAFDERLRSLAEWYASITAESLGKNGGGITPIVSVGSRDNHSMLQLYLQGPKDKFTTFISLSNTDSYNLQTLEAVKKAYDDEKLPYIHVELDASSSDVLTCELGDFMQSKIIETVLLGGLMGVNPYDQPGVELYKKYLQ
jgi:glucose-6-phosphate isomerase